MSWLWDDFYDGVISSIPFTSGSHTTDILTTGRTDYWPTRGNPFSSQFELDYAFGFYAGMTSQGLLFFLGGLAQWGMERALFRRIWAPIVLYESGRLTYEAAVRIEESSPGNQMVVPSVMNMWGSAGNFSGGAMPVVDIYQLQGTWTGADYSPPSETYDNPYR